MKEKVPCINAEYGCPAILFRKSRSKHLISCPASVVHCSEEWDRWPIHLQDTKAILNSSNLDPVVRNHLDVCLALRDQRMLRRWCASAELGEPELNYKFAISATSTLWIYRKWQTNKEHFFPPGLEESVIKELCKKQHETSNGTSNSLSHSKTNDCNSSRLYDSEFSDSNETYNKENAGDSNNKIVESNESKNKQKIENKNNKLSNFGKLSQESNGPGELPYYNLDDVLQLCQFGTIVYNHSTAEGSIYVAVDPAEPHPYLVNGQPFATCQVIDLKFKNPSSTPPWCLSLGLDLNVEARSQHPPSNFMYTFLCCQEFRRDEYGCHYKNVHSEIHGGLNGWLLERCPLAQYGSFTDHEKLDSDTTIKNSSNSMKHEQSQLNLVDLPFDVLQHIVRYLDSFSLANLSLTSSLLRQVCSTVLKEQGLVCLKWERHKTKDNKVTWKVAKQKRWFFSSHFSPIHSWTMEDKNNMANHLKVCPYFNRISQKKAFRYGDPHDLDPPQDKRYYDPLKDVNEHNMTKL
ncbi:f-box only protein 30 [Caerostris darwini]|uniref:F-box only protein 30 n=1 Tax=Caerostris darwini TaxID=1538125 RepID=A0AAV4RDS3_9ARAC|nr:f-box only protein 30 [Caerostris darwini]